MNCQVLSIVGKNVDSTGKAVKWDILDRMGAINDCFFKWANQGMDPNLKEQVWRLRGRIRLARTPTNTSTHMHTHTHTRARARTHARTHTENTATLRRCGGCGTRRTALG